MATTDATAPPASTSIATSSAMLCRDAWGARPARPGGTPQVPNRMTIHHSAVVLGSNSNAPGRIRADQRYHQDSKGWIDIAYHVGVDRNGNIYELRDPGLVGDTATTYDPTGHFLVLCEGDYDQETVTEDMLNGVARACAWAAQRYSISVDRLAGHRDFAATSCPGANLYAHIASGDIKGRIQSLVASRRRRPGEGVWARSNCTSHRDRGGRLSNSAQTRPSKGPPSDFAERSTDLAVRAGTSQPDHEGCLERRARQQTTRPRRAPRAALHHVEPWWIRAAHHRKCHGGPHPNSASRATLSSKMSETWTLCRGGRRPPRTPEFRSGGAAQPPWAPIKSARTRTHAGCPQRDPAENPRCSDAA